MDPFSTEAVRGAYDATAADYVREFGDDLDRLPLDREMLDAAWVATGAPGWVLELGCGPAPAAHYLADRAHDVLGVDLSAAMLHAACARNRGLRTAQADLRRLPLRDGACSLAIAYYSLQHVPRAELTAALREVGRVLRDGGALLAATHLGDGDVVIDEFLGHRITPVAGALYCRTEILDALGEAGFRVEEERQRGPLPHEYDSQRIYVLARRAIR